MELKAAKKKAADYRDLIAAYVDANYSSRGIVVYTEVPLGKTIIGKNRRIDVLALRRADQRALAIECKYQDVLGTTDEKFPYALQDLEAMWIPACLVYAGTGWSQGVLHTLEGSRLAVHCLPERSDLARTKQTQELDHVLAAVFGLWDRVLPENRLFSNAEQLSLPLKGPRKIEPAATSTPRKAADDDG
jgi:hypothetical protein